MAGHTDYALGWQHHGGCADWIAFVMTTPAGGLFYRCVHLVNVADSVGSGDGAPGDAAVVMAPQRNYRVQMAGPAGYTRMGVMGHLLVMGHMALAAIPQDLSAVTKGHRLWVADTAGNIPVGGGRVLLNIDQGM